jgi:hypothetical protein
MELKLNIYVDRKLKEVEKTYVVNDFELSTGACEDLLNIINIDMFDGSLEALSDESKLAEMLKMIVGGVSVFKDILKDVFDELTDDEIKRTRTSEIIKCVASIIKYSITGLTSSFGSSKNK